MVRRRRSGWTPSFLYDSADTDTWQKTLVEQARLGPDGVSAGWLTLREPTADFFDARRREELLSASGSRRRPATHATSRRPGWGQSGTATPRSAQNGTAPVGDGARYGDNHEEAIRHESDKTGQVQSVQLMPKYLIARHLKEADRRLGQRLPMRQKPVRSLEKVYAPKVPALDLARAGLKSAPSRISGWGYDQVRPNTLRHEKKELNVASVAQAPAQTPRTAADFSSLPAPLQEALALCGSGRSGAVSERLDPSMALEQGRRALVVVAENMPDTFLTNHDTPDPPTAGRVNMTPRQRLAHQKSSQVCLQRVSVLLQHVYSRRPGNMNPIERVCPSSTHSSSSLCAVFAPLVIQRPSVVDSRSLTLRTLKEKSTHDARFRGAYC